MKNPQEKAAQPKKTKKKESCPKNMLQHWRYKPANPVEITLVKPPNFRRPRRHSSPSIDHYVNHFRLGAEKAQAQLEDGIQALLTPGLPITMARSQPPSPQTTSPIPSPTPSPYGSPAPSPSISPVHSPVHSPIHSPLPSPLHSPSTSLAPSPVTSPRSPPLARFRSLTLSPRTRRSTSRSPSRHRTQTTSSPTPGSAFQPYPGQNRSLLSNELPQELFMNDSGMAVITEPLPPPDVLSYDLRMSLSSINTYHSSSSTLAPFSPLSSSGETTSNDVVMASVDPPTEKSQPSPIQALMEINERPSTPTSRRRTLPPPVVVIDADNTPPSRNQSPLRSSLGRRTMAVDFLVSNKGSTSSPPASPPINGLVNENRHKMSISNLIEQT